MNLPPIPEDWRTDWHLAANLDQFSGDQTVDVTVAGIVLHMKNTEGGLTACSDERNYPVMVVDDEVFVLMSDGPD
jgi:hypothetical protein